MGIDIRQLTYLVIILSNFYIPLTLSVNYDLSHEYAVRENIDLGNMEDFFKSFDTNENNKLDSNEANSYYNWIKRNVKYRYDNEYETNPIEGFLIGDGRNGLDYMQTPEETYSELAGDCEDQSNLHVAFFNYWGYEAIIGIVDISDSEKHAIALVKNDNSSNAVIGSGEILVYGIDNDQADYYGITSGSYIIVDTLYGTRIGDYSGSNKTLSSKLVR